MVGRMLNPVVLPESHNNELKKRITEPSWNHGTELYTSIRVEA